MAWNSMVNGAGMNWYAQDQLKQIMEAQQEKERREEQIGAMQRAATMAQHMDPETMAGIFVGQLLGDAISGWLSGEDGGGGGAGNASAAATASVLPSSGGSDVSTAPMIGGQYGDISYSPELAQVDYMMTGNPGNFGIGGTPSQALNNEVTQRGIENTLKGISPFDNQAAANDVVASVGLLGGGFSPENYSLRKRIDERYRGWM